LGWGIPVPGDDSQTIYVWADALLNYISALDYPDGENFKRYWPPDIHFLGKDILRFHTTIWLGMLLSLGLDLPKNIFVHGFVTSGGQKMSKSLGNVISPFELVQKYGSDAVRYFLLREIPPTEDGDFTYQKIKDRYNADLAAGLGNLVSRVINMASGIKTGNQKFPPAGRAGKIKNKSFAKKIKLTEKKWHKLLGEFRFNEALIAVWELIRFSDQYIDKESPWKKSKNQIFVINDLLIALANIAQFLSPFLPETSRKILNQLGLESFEKENVFKIKKSGPLFPRAM
jgi:methionyl-tRNA synthetase